VSDATISHFFKNYWSIWNVLALMLSIKLNIYRLIVKAYNESALA
jgi:hypothetical protein